jgi:hypothetical protein
MAAAVERQMDKELDGDPERVRRILSYRAARAETETERAALVDMLETSLRHASPRVRLHAHVYSKGMPTARATSPRRVCSSGIAIRQRFGARFAFWRLAAPWTRFPRSVICSFIHTHR